MSAERFFDDLARTLAEPMPRRRAVRVIGASLVAIAVPNVSPRLARAGATRPATRGSIAAPGATCPDGSVCSSGTVCCQQKSPLSGAYNCCKSQAHCCCGNKCCDPFKQRCLCPEPGGAGGYCAPNCPVTNGRNWKNCGPGCCQPHERCVDNVNGKCVSCEQEGKQTCRSYDDRTTVICCPATRGSKSSCCANLATAVCCGEKQTCKATGGRARCVCTEGRKCGLKCCAANESCCGGGACCGTGETCCGNLACCGRNEWCLHKETGTIFNVPTCKPSCAPSNRAGRHCCGTGYEPNPSRTRCVPA